MSTVHNPSSPDQLLKKLDHRVPRATYRLQFNPAAGFTFKQAEQIVPYLAELGVSDLYSSPLQTPRSGSPHGYDIVNHDEINPALGGRKGFDSLSTALRSRKMGLILDVVPNHMGIGNGQNDWWLDVLENGPSSIYGEYFDIDWDPVLTQLRDKVLIPILGDQYGAVLENGELRLAYEDGGFVIYYWEHRLPIAPGSYDQILAHRLDQLLEVPGPNDPGVQELQSIITAIGYLPPRNETEPERIVERHREKEIIKRRLAVLYEDSAPVHEAIDATINEYNGTPGDPASFNLLESLIDRQAYRPAFWRVATEEINYRRFFDINDLAAIRVELPDVLQVTHRLVFELLSAGEVTGLRIDHPDGLWDPPAYFRRLQENYLRYMLAASLPATDNAEELVAARLREVGNPPRWPLYVVAEKILSPGEPLPADWAVDGTTGYDFLNGVNGVLVNAAAERELSRLYVDVTGPQLSFANLVNAKKKEIMLVALSSEINALSHELDRISEKNRRYRDFTLNSLTFALREVIACLPVYRTYIAGIGQVAEQDVAYIEAAVREAKRRNPRTAAAIFDFIGDTLLMRNLAGFSQEQYEQLLRFVMKLQQVSGPVMAKGVEDTTFYVYNRFAALNEVGGHPEHLGVSVAELHRSAAERQRRWPHAMLASTTHDTKRSEDVRARMAVISEAPREWRQMIAVWSRQNMSKKTLRDGALMPSRNDEYLLYQTLVGSWPIPAGGATRAGLPELPADYVERIAAYMEKATREAKVQTSWINPNEAYDNAVRDFVYGIFDQRRSKRFLSSMEAFARRMAFFGRFNALSQQLIKLTAPGVPDIYQGTELWTDSLVDPDNRRPVDYVLRRKLLADLRKAMAGDRAQLAENLLGCAGDGRIKLYLTYLALQLCAEQPALFAEGDYLPLEATGDKEEHVIAFARRHGSQELIAVVPRLCLLLAGGAELPPLGDIWGDTALQVSHATPATRYRNLFTGDELTPIGGRLALSEILQRFPVALLVK
jgi:(1->4)-alpha-D-glucan 1-alpha-D-glucosylmutase